MTWQLRKPDGTVYGPIDHAGLQRWAREGRIAPDDEIAGADGLWQSAPDLPELEMDWIITMQDGSKYGPMHLEAMEEALKDGTILPNAPVRHKAQQQTQMVGDLLARPLNEVSKEPQAVSSAPEQTTAEPDQPASADMPQPPEPPSTWKETARRKDYFEREAQKWKRMYEQERRDAQRREDEMQERIEELRQSEISARTIRNQVEHKLMQIDKNYVLLKETVSANHSEHPDADRMATLMEAYNNLAENYDTVLSQLTGKSEELQSMQETRQQLEKEMKERLARMDRIVEREQQEADRARIRLAEIEHTHHQLLRSFRELNDRYIHLRERQARSTPEPASASTVQDSSGKTSKSRLKLNRG